jgi:RNA recognition motif-containing protein
LQTTLDTRVIKAFLGSGQKQKHTQKPNLCYGYPHMKKRLFVRNLALSVDSSTLESMFMTVGNVESADVILDGSTGTSRGMGYVEMSTEQEALDCISRFHGTKSHGAVLIVTKDEPHIPLPKVAKKKA